MKPPSPPSPPPPLRKPDVRTVVERLAAEGAIMTVCHSPCHSYLVGSLRWAEEPGPRVLFFAANGNSAADGHALEFDLVRAHEEAVHFFQCGEQVGTLAPIEKAEVADRDDYRVGWSIWQQIEPLKKGYVSSLLDQLEVEFQRVV
jgi:hypothetical protein